MTKQFRPVESVQPLNGRVVGISIDRNGKITKVRVQWKFKPKDDVPIFSEPISLNPINVVWEKARAIK
jgi:hypothetical protein